MARRIFISFRYKDGVKYKEKLSKIFDEETEIINCSEDKDRSSMSDETIKKYLYAKLKTTSVTIVLLTPDAINHRKDRFGFYDDWMYDEIRYSLEDRENDRCNGLIAVYVPEAEQMLVQESIHTCNVCKNYKKIITICDVDNLFRKNMMNIKSEYKMHPCEGLYDADEDSYCTLIPWETFIENYQEYIDRAATKRENTHKYTMVKRL